MKEIFHKTTDKLGSVYMLQFGRIMFTFATGWFSGSRFKAMILPKGLNGR